ncbi:MAG: ATP-dependent DNA helicase RecG [Candidatus Zixiibacteriota bacterium]
MASNLPPVAELKLNSPLQYVKGVGPKKAAVLARHGLNTVEDILYYFPRQYLDRSNIVRIADLKIDQPATILGEVKAHGILQGRRTRYEVILGDQSGHVSLIWFAGIRFWERMFKKGMKIAATGTPSYFQGLQIIHPDLERLDDFSDQLVHAGRIIPVYPQTAELSQVGLSSRGMRTVTTFIFDNLKEKLDEYLPESVRGQQQLLPRHVAVTNTHYPESSEQIEQCRRRLAFDELLQLQFLVSRNKGRKASITKEHNYSAPGAMLTQLRRRLPFELTAEQKKVIKEIFQDMQGERPMSRLLHGEVGCGKTVVAVVAGLYAVENGLQCAFMAPTEILAEQHYRNWGTALDECGAHSALLTASLTTAQKKKIAERCAEGAIDILFGTHALIYDYVSFKQLGLVVIDEQHRFGVEQRGRLYVKGADPDLLVMTATPIPRTLALTLYGDLDISTIKDVPPGRKPIRTVWRMSDSRDKVWQFIRDETGRGGQAYIIYPLIEKSEQSELENVEDAYAELSAGALNGLRLGIVHGRVKSKERDTIIRQFRDGQIDVLMSTTVIEVGIDNPNATVLVIEHAERFGLAQLHQLRGRIGRGGKAATAVAIAHAPVSPIARQRLEFFAQHGDGFLIAEADLQLRGPGEIFGVRQSGLPELRAANLWADRDLMEAARELLERIVGNRDQLDSEHQRLYNYLSRVAERRELLLGGG